MSHIICFRGLPGFAAGFLLCLFSLPGIAIASNSFLEDSERGWFWYEEPEVPPELSELPEASPRGVTEEADDSEEKVAADRRERRTAGLSEDTVDAYVAGLPRTEQGELMSADLKTLLPKALEFAVDNPNQINVMRYFTLQRMTMNKSERFAAESRRLVMLNPELDEMAGAVRSQRQREEDERSESGELREKLKLLSENVILVYLYQGTCPYCKMGVTQINALADSGFKVMGISLDGVFLEDLKAEVNIHEPNAAAFYGIDSVPVLIAVDAEGNREPGHTVIMSGGLLNLGELEYRLANSLKLFEEKRK